MRIHFVLAGLHRVRRGAEVAFESIAQNIALAGQDEVTVFGSGHTLAGRAYGFQHVPLIVRERFERWPSVPFLRNDCMYEELTFAAGLLATRRAGAADVTVTCGYPYTNWALRSWGTGPASAAHVFVTQNGDWPAISDKREYRFFACDGLVCTNPQYWQRNRERWNTTLIPNGIDPSKFHPGPANRAALGLPENARIVLFASALVANKRVVEGLRAVAQIPDAFCVVAGDGPLRQEVDQLAAQLLPGRFLRKTFPHHQMADLYRSADVFFHPCIGESFGNVYVEALSCGVPVVAHDEAITRWIFEDHAVLVNTDDEAATVAALRRALLTPPAARAAGAGFARARYDWSTIAAQYRAFLAGVVERRRSGVAEARKIAATQVE